MEIKNQINKNEYFISDIDGWSSDGSGVAHINGYAVFVPKTIVGEVWKIKIVKVTKTAIYGRPIELVHPSAERISIECPHYGLCGGCSTMHMGYEKELEFKLSKINNSLAKIGKLDFKINQVIPSEKITGYRNKSICAVGVDENHVRVGFYKKRSHGIIPVENCLLQNDLTNRINQSVEKWLNDNDVKPYDEQTRKGTIRHIFVRTSSLNKQAVVCLVVARGFGSKTDDLVSYLTKRHSEIKGIVLNVNKDPGNVILSNEFYSLYGDCFITEEICGMKFDVSPQSFLQVNSKQTETLYQKVKEYVGNNKVSCIVDLYCGVGSIGICLAEKTEKLIGAEIIDEAVKNAKHNAEINNITNAEYMCADAGDAANYLISQNISPECIVVDPPRKGLDENTIGAIGKMNPQKLIYVSCNPATLARDLSEIVRYGYEIEEGCGVDMFPRTSHVETVILLTKTY